VRSLPEVRNCVAYKEQVKREGGTKSSESKGRKYGTRDALLVFFFDDAIVSCISLSMRNAPAKKIAWHTRVYPLALSRLLFARFRLFLSSDISDSAPSPRIGFLAPYERISDIVCHVA